MDDQYCDQGYWRRKNRFSAFDSNIENYNRRVPMKRGNSVHAANLSMDADYFNSHHGQYDCAPDFRESYATQYNFDNSRLSNPHEWQVVARNRYSYSHHNSPARETKSNILNINLYIKIIFLFKMFIEILKNKN